MNNTQIADKYCKSISDIRIQGDNMPNHDYRVALGMAKAKALQHKEDCERFLNFMKTMRGRSFQLVTHEEVEEIKDLSNAIKIYKENGI